jgi:alkaline phosphatase
MFSKGYLDVIGGSGNPEFDNDGNPAAAPVYAPPLPATGGGWIYANLWQDLKNNTNLSGKNPYGFTLLQNREDVQALAAKTGAFAKPPAHVAMIGKGLTSLQFNRTNILKRADGVTPIDATQDTVYGTPLKTNVPSQAELTIAALNVLDQNGRGFYLMTEGGAVDRAEHANDTARMIEELDASDETVKAIIEWVNRKGTAATWGNTLLIVTADHDHLLYGPNGDTVPFQPLQDKGAGKVPGTRWFGPNHGVGLVPLFAYGQGAKALMSLASKVDSYTDASGKTWGHGLYVDQTELGAVLKATAAQTLKKIH